MSDSDFIPEYARNHEYGNGTYYRRVRLENEPGRVVGGLEDTHHAFRVVLEHDGETITAVHGEAIRHPLTTCPGAIAPLQGLVGLPVGLNGREVSRRVPAKENCTHWYDLAVLALTHAGRDQTVRQFDVAITDEVDEPARCRVWIDDELIHDWQVSNWQIVTPEPFAGRPIFWGFAKWGADAFEGDAQEAAFVMHKGYFVAQARRVDVNKMAGEPARNHSPMLGVCYSYGEPVIDDAVRTQGHARDFSDDQTQLLKFL